MEKQVGTSPEAIKLRVGRRGRKKKTNLDKDGTCLTRRKKKRQAG